MQSTTSMVDEDCASRQTDLTEGCTKHHFIFDTENQEDVCDQCGLVVIPSYQTNEEDEIKKIDINQKEYVVSKATDVDFSCGGFLSTRIDPKNIDFIGKRVNQMHYNKIRYINNYILSSAGMSTYKNAIWLIASMSDRLVLPAYVKERAAEIFKKMYYSKTNIHNSKNIVCACLYYACKEARINRTLTDISNAVQEQEGYTSDIFTTYQKLMESLDLEVPKNFSILEEISYLGSRIGVSEKVVRHATNIYQQIKRKDRIYFAGKSPRITATILLFISAKLFDSLDEDNFCVSAEISPYILKRRVADHLEHENFKEYSSLVSL